MCVRKYECRIREKTIFLNYYILNTNFVDNFFFLSKINEKRRMWQQWETNGGGRISPRGYTQRFSLKLYIFIGASLHIVKCVCNS